MTRALPVEPVSVSRRAACERLNIGSRWLRELIALGRLTVEGSGHASRITVASLEAEVARQKNRKSRPVNPGIPGNSQRSVPKFFDSRLDSDTAGQQNGGDSMLVRFPNRVECEPVAELISISRAAALIGVGDALLRTAAVKGQLPTRIIGKRRLVEKGVLRDWVKGTCGTEGER